ncbi:MAG: TetR/AcrR family transcriptional regulator [Bacteroidia bacterium]|nr:TetR/AcrR family transcriptional regulator [Bacteroidia bacterium]
MKKVKDLYQKYGIKSITMEDVSRELGISKKTLYQYVSDKNELVNKIIDYEISIRAEGMDAIEHMNLNAIEELIEYNKNINIMLREYNPSMEYDLKKYYPDAFARIREIRRQRMYEKVLANMKKGKAEGIFRADLNEEIIARLYVSRTDNLFGDELFSINESTSNKFSLEVFIYHIRGIANKNGIKILEQKLQELNHNKNE